MSDLTVALVGARAWWAGLEPYQAARDTAGSTYGLLYPFPAVLTVLPIAWVEWPEAIFVGLGIALWGAGVSGRHPAAWWAFASPAGWYVVRFAQWEPLLAGAALLNFPGALLACKPQLGAALFAAWPTRRALYGGLAVTVASLVVYPGWPEAWAAGLHAFGHSQVPLLQWGGPLILAALLEWRRPEARLLVALACVPATPEVYQLLPLFLVPGSHRQGAALAGLVTLADLVSTQPDSVDYAVQMAGLAQWTTWLVYLPCTWMVAGDRLRSTWRQRRRFRTARADACGTPHHAGVDLGSQR